MIPRQCVVEGAFFHVDSTDELGRLVDFGTCTGVKDCERAIQWSAVAVAQLLHRPKLEVCESYPCLKKHSKTRWLVPVECKHGRKGENDLRWRAKALLCML